MLIVVDAQGRTRQLVDTLEVKTFGGDDAPTLPTGEQRYPLPSSNGWPVLVGLTPRLGNTNRVWAVEIRALRVGDGTGDLQLVRRVIGTYARGKVVLLRLELEDLCLLERNRDLECGTELARTCLAGACADTPRVDPGQLPTWDGQRPAGSVDSGADGAGGGEDASDFDLGGETRDAGDAGREASASDGAIDGTLPDADPTVCTRDVDCDDGVACTLDRCIDGTCDRTPDDARCTATACTSDVRCLPDEGGCIEEVTVCDDMIACTDDSCNPSTGCVFTPNDSRCGAGATCDLTIRGCRGGSCMTHADCADADMCNLDRCVDGICEHPPGMGCADSNPCTDSRCVPETGACEVTNNTAFCDDGDACTASSRCSAGTCTGVPISCTGGNPCVTGSCSAATGMCTNMPRPDGTDCGSGRVCCAERCADTASDPLACGACGTVCGANQTCSAGRCRCNAPWLDCTAAPGCETNPESDPAHCSGCNMPCSAGQSCVMGVCRACTSDAQCAPSLSCQAGRCNAGVCQVSTDPGFCVIGGVCVAMGAADPSNQCRSCQPSVSQTAYSPRTGMCNDGLYCNVGETCTGAMCGGGTPRDCSDARTCTMDVCDEAGDRCSNPLLAGFCLIAGVCRTDGEINPANPCQICNPSMSTTAWSGNDGAMCVDTLFCTQTACVGTMCSVTGPTDCSDAFSCTTDSCNEVMDICEHAIVAGACLIDSACRVSGEGHPSNECLECNPAMSQTSWSPVASGTSCGGGMCAGDVCIPRADMGPPPDAGVMDMGPVEEDGAVMCFAPDEAGCAPVGT